MQDIQKAEGNSGDDVILNRQGKGEAGRGRMAARAGYAIGNEWLREVKTVRDIQSAAGNQFGNKR